MGFFDKPRGGGQKTVTNASAEPRRNPDHIPPAKPGRGGQQRHQSATTVPPPSKYPAPAKKG